MYNTLSIKKKISICEEVDADFDNYYEIANEFGYLSASKYRSLRKTRQRCRNAFRVPYILINEIEIKFNLSGLALKNSDALILLTAMYSERTFDARHINPNWETPNIVFNNEERKLIANAVSKIEPITDISYSVMVKLNSLEECE